MSSPLTPEDLKVYLTQHAISGEVVALTEPTPTVQTAAAAVGVEPEQIIKSLLFLAVDEPVLVIANGTSRVEWKMLAAYLGISRRKLHMADPATVLALTGYPVGGVPPLGHPQPLRVVIEAGVLEHEWVYGGGGSEHALLHVQPQQLAEHLQAEVVDLQAPPKEQNV
ncbi:MAG: YbaK/EbsC family protein [Chloroflexota bacterium]